MYDVERIKEITQRSKDATPGPWEIGVWYHLAAVHDETADPEWEYRKTFAWGCCAMCREGNEPIATVSRESRTGRMCNYHVHRSECQNEWRQVVSAHTYGDICGNYDYEEGGVASTREDAEFIAHAREDIPYLLDVIGQLLADREG